MTLFQLINMKILKANHFPGLIKVNFSSTNEYLYLYTRNLEICLKPSFSLHYPFVSVWAGREY